MIAPLREVLKRREMLTTLIARNLKIRYRNSTLGFVWTVLNPIFMALIYWLFIVRVARAPVSIGEILVGVFAWNYVVMSVMDAVHAVVGNANLVKKIAFPRIILPLSTSMANVVNFLLSQFIVAAYLVGTRSPPGPWLALLPLVVLAHFCLCLGLALLVSCANVFFRDTEHIVGVLLTAWFFLSPVMYTLRILEDQGGRMLALYALNPLAGIITAYRAILLPAATVVPPPWAWAGSFAMCAAVLLLGYVSFQRLQPYFGDVL